MSVTIQDIEKFKGLLNFQRHNMSQSIHIDEFAGLVGLSQMLLEERDQAIAERNAARNLLIINSNAAPKIGVQMAIDEAIKAEAKRIMEEGK